MKVGNKMLFYFPVILYTFKDLYYKIEYKQQQKKKAYSIVK